MPSSRARSSADSALIDSKPAPKPRAARKTPVARATPALAAAPADAASSETSTTPPPARKAAAKKVAAKKTAAKKAVAEHVVAVAQAGEVPASKVAAKKTRLAKALAAEPDEGVPAAKRPAVKNPAVKKSARSRVGAPVATEVSSGGADEAAPVAAKQARGNPKATPRGAKAVKRSTTAAVAEAVRAVDAVDSDEVTATADASEPGPAEPRADLEAAAEKAAVSAEVTPAPESAPEPAVTPYVEEPPSVPAWSEVSLQADAWGQFLAWRAGAGCPAGVLQQAQALLDADGKLDPMNDHGLLALYQAAQDAGHALHIDAQVWSAVAAGRDLRWRAHLLEQAYPEGAASAALQALWPASAGRLTGFQWEGALFAACVGNSLLADDAGMGHAPQALAAAGLLSRHFGVQRVLIVCPDARLPRWQGLLASMEAWPHRLCGESAWAAVAAEVAVWAPELVIVDDTVSWQQGDGVPARLRALSPTYRTVLMPAPAERPQALAQWLAWLDPQRLGVSRQFLRRHGSDTGAWSALDRLRDTLTPVMLRRTRSRWLQPVPGRRDRLVWVPMDGATRAAHEAALRPLRSVVARWRNAHYVSDQDQLTAHQAVMALREACAVHTAPKRAMLETLRHESASGGVCVELPWPLSARREPQPTGEMPWPATYLLMAGGLDEQRLWLRCLDPQADEWLCDPAPFRQGAALARRLEVWGWLVDLWRDFDEVSLRNTHSHLAC